MKTRTPVFVYIFFAIICCIVLYLITIFILNAQVYTDPKKEPEAVSVFHENYERFQKVATYLEDNMYELDEYCIDDHNTSVVVNTEIEDDVLYILTTLGCNYISNSEDSVIFSWSGSSRRNLFREDYWWIYITFSRKQPNFSYSDKLRNDWYYIRHYGV